MTEPIDFTEFEGTVEVEIVIRSGTVFLCRCAVWSSPMKWERFFDFHVSREHLIILVDPYDVLMVATRLALMFNATYIPVGAYKE